VGAHVLDVFMPQRGLICQTNTKTACVSIPGDILAARGYICRARCSMPSAPTPGDFLDCQPAWRASVCAALPAPESHRPRHRASPRPAPGHHLLLPPSDGLCWLW